MNIAILLLGRGGTHPDSAVQKRHKISNVTCQASTSNDYALWVPVVTMKSGAISLFIHSELFVIDCSVRPLRDGLH